MCGAVYLVYSNVLGVPTGSGKSDYDYPALTASIPSLEALPFYSPTQRTPLPPDLVEQFDRILACDCKQLYNYNYIINGITRKVDMELKLWLVSTLGCQN